MNDSQNKFQSLKNNSLNGQPIHKENITKQKIQKTTLKKKIIKCSLCIGLMAGIAGMVLKPSPATVINEYVDSNNLNIVSRNTYRTEDNKGYYYSHQQIAREILDSDNPEILIYICFREMDSDTTQKYGNQEIRNMNYVFNELNSQCQNDSIYKNYDSFEQYLISNGYCDNDGKPDYKLYDKYMQVRLIRIIENEKKEKTY